MAIREISVQRFSVVSSLPFDEVVAKLEARIGHPDTSLFRKEIASAQNEAEFTEVVNKAIGPAGLMEFIRFDLNRALRHQVGPKAPRSFRFVVGNPLIMVQMVRHVPDAGSYAPVTILVDERADGVHLSYDRMASLLAPYGNSEALRVAKDLDDKVEILLNSAAL